MSKLNPRVDFAFKLLFGTEENKDLLLTLINSILSLKHPLTEITLLNPYNHKNHSRDKLSILDIKAKDARGVLYNIEMQMTDQVDYDQRALYYWSKLYTQQLSEGRNFAHLRKTISIHILNFNCFDEADFHNVYHVLNAKTFRRRFEDLELHFIELQKFTKDLAHVTTALDRWVAFLTQAEEWDRNFVPTELRTDPAIEKAARKLDELSLDNEEREIYEAKLKWLRTEEATIEKVKLVYEEKGRAENQIEIAKNMLFENMAISLIAKMTGLSETTVEALKKEVATQGSN